MLGGVGPLRTIPGVATERSGEVGYEDDAMLRS